MEEPKPEQPTPPTQAPDPNPNPNPNPQSTTQKLPPQPPPSSLPPPISRKRPLDNNAHIENSNYFKMRTVLKDLRPHFIEILRTDDFQNCKAALEIREKLKLLMDLYKEITAETITMVKCKSVPEGHQPLKSSEPILVGRTSEKPQPDGTQILGTYIIGGSAFGWNFITFPGNKAVYYGRTKESFRSANVIPPPPPA